MSRIEESSKDALYIPEAQGRWRRRLLSISMYSLLWLVLTLLSPVLFALALLAGLVRRVRFAIARVLAFFWLYLTCELIGIGVSFCLWLAKLLRPGLAPSRYRDWHFALQRWWAGTLWSGVRILFSLRLEVSGQACAADGPYLLLIRHASVADTLLASAFIGVPFGMQLRYVLKRELLWDPCLDIVGHRIPNAFIKRGADDASETLSIIDALASNLSEREGVLIYPEGTRFTRSKRERILTKLKERADSPEGEAALALATSLTHTLPPRPKGTLQLMKTQPDADVVFCVHSGFEKITSFWHLWRGAPIGGTVYVHFWRVSGADIPKDEIGRVDWLNEQWGLVNEWVAERGE